MATSVASQLQAVTSVVKGTADPIKKSLSRPSILFGPKEAADIDVGTILPIALSGLEALVEVDSRFARYKDTLFSHTSLDMDREKGFSKEEQRLLNRSICSYLRLLSGHLELPAALKTLEYLIRRYRVHVFNVEDLVLCALPYHYTHAFVKIVQLLELGNKKWAFLEGVKSSGAPPPRKVIVQQCIRDKGVLEAICNYASPAKNIQHARPVVCFCTAVVVETLGSIPKLDTDTVQRVLPFVFNSLKPDIKGSMDHKAGALMVVGLLATRATLASELIQNLVFFIARMSQQDAEQSADLPWIRATIMAVVSLVQSQSTYLFQKKTMMILKEIRDFPGILSRLSQEFNIQKFLCLYLETLVNFSTSDASCLHALIKTIEILPSKDFIEKIVSKLLTDCVKLLRNAHISNSHEAGNRAKKVLAVIDKHYSSELHAAVRKFLKNSKLNLREEDSIFESFCQMFDDGLNVSKEISHPRILFSLEHPKPEVRQMALSGIAESGYLKDVAADPQKLINVQSAILCRLHDDDLSVVQTALSMDGLAEVIAPSCLFKAYQDVLFRCIDIINKGTSITSRACDVAALCLERMVLDVSLHHFDNSKEVATVVFPFLFVLPKTWKVNLKVLEIIKQLRGTFYTDSNIALDLTSFKQIKNLEPHQITSVNVGTIKALAETFVKNPQDHIQWLSECGKCSEVAKNLFLFIVLQALVICSEESGSILQLYKACSAILRNDWHEMGSHHNVILAEEFSMDNLDKSGDGLVEQLLNSDIESREVNIHTCIYWCLLKAFTKSVNRNTLENYCEQILILDELFLFFSTSPSKNVFKKHVHFLVRNCSSAPFRFLSKYFVEEGYSVEVQVESLLLFATICSEYSSCERSNMGENNYLQLLLGFPSLLIPLSSENKDIRTAAVNCIEGIYQLWHRFDISRLKNGNDSILSRCISTSTFGDLLESIISQKELICSDFNFLPSYLMSMFSPSGYSLLAPEHINRFDQAAKDAIITFILSSALKFASYGKLVVLSLFRGLGNAMLVDGVKLLLFELLERRNRYYSGLDKSCQQLSKIEIDTLCFLLEVSIRPSNSAHIDADILDCLLKALKVDGLSSDDPAVVQPCVAALQNLTCGLFDTLNTDMQDELFGSLVFLFRSDNGDIRNTAREALLRINVNCSTIVKVFELLLSVDQGGSSKRLKREKFLTHKISLPQNLYNREEATVLGLCSLLDILLLKKHMKKRESLVQPLFHAVEILFSKERFLGLVSLGDQGRESFSDLPESITGGLYYAQQTSLLILKDITDSLLLGDPLKDDICNKSNMNVLLKCAQTAEDASTRNHIFLLLSSIAKVFPGQLSEHIIDIFTVIGASAVKQIDSHSQHVMEDLISALIPCWLSKINSIGELLQIFIKASLDVSGHRRLTLMVYLLRSLGEKDSLGVLIFHLFRSLINRSVKSSSYCEKGVHSLFSSPVIISEWEYKFAAHVCNQYSCEIWFPCLLSLLQEIEMHFEQEELIHVLHLAMQFILDKLQDPELVFQLESDQNADYLQNTLGGLVEQVVLHLQLLNVRSIQHSVSRDAVKGVKECASRVLRTITRRMCPSVFFKYITQLLEHADGNVKKKTLGLLCETIKDHGLVQKKFEKKGNRKYKSTPFQLDETATSSFNGLCLKIVKLITSTCEDSDNSVKLAAISSLELLAKELPSDNLIFATCLSCVVKYIGSADFAISSACLRSTGALIGVLGLKSLSELPHIMKQMLDRAHAISNCPIENSKYSSRMTCTEVLSHKMPLSLSILIALEAVVANLGGFLNPYFEDVLDLIVLHPEYVLESDMKIKLKAATVRKLLTEKIPVRLMLSPLLKIYFNALKCGESSLCLVFEMLASMIGVMDRASIGSYHMKIFEQCLTALDIRHQRPESVKDVNMVEQSVIHTMIALTMKLTGTMFRPLFLHTLEWAESKLEGSGSTIGISMDRKLSFYKLVNKLVEQHRSLFVPYFKFLLEGCTQYLSQDEDVDSIPLTQKRKKAKVGSATAKVLLSPKQWHLKSLIVESLYKCFLYDTADQKFLDASNFQVLLKPIVSQFVAEPPAPAELPTDVPTVEEVDKSLVLCLGQMAITARSDVLWKPLNHEVLMQTRSEKLRPKILGLKVIKYLVEHLKEEYLVFLPETIPFLGELLEDVELPVKTLAQEILKEMETLSGENLRQYL